MEEKERYEVMSPSLNGYAYIHDFKTDNVLNTYDSCDLLNQQSKRIKELEKALDYAIFELDFARNHSQSTNSETIERIDKLRNKILNKAKEMLENE